MLFQLLKRFQRSEIIIQSHLIKDFTIFYLLIVQVRFLHFFSFMLALFGGFNECSLALYGYMQSLHGLFLILLSFVNLYIMLCCNTITTEMVMQGAKTAAYFVGGSLMTHNALSLYFIPPNTISNAYHIYSPTGRGYGAYSCSQLIAVDALKGAQGPRFDPSTIINKDNMLDNTKIAKQFKHESNLPTLAEFLGKSKKL